MLYEGHPESKERLRIQSALLFCCIRSLVSGVQCDVEKFLMQLYVGPCHVVSAEITVVVVMPIENAADCEVRGVISFLQLDEISGYLAEEISSRVELFCCTSAYCPADTSLAAREIPLGHLRASSVQSGLGTVGLFPLSKKWSTLLTITT